MKLRILFLFCCVFSCSLMISPADAAKSRQNLLNSITARLNADVSSTGLNQLPATEKTRRINVVTKSVNYLPTDSIDDNLAQWIEDSLVELLSRNPLTPNEESKDRENLTLQLIERRLNGLNEEKGKSLLLLRDKLVESSAEFEKSLQFFFFQELANSKNIELSLDGRSEDMLSLVAIGMRPDLRILVDRVKSEEPNGLIVRGVDVSSEKIDSALLTLSIIRFTHSTVKFKEKIHVKGFENIFSGAFEDGDPLQMRSLKQFDSVQAILHEEFKARFTQDAGIKLTADSLEDFIWFALDRVRITDVVRQKFSPKSKAKLPSGIVGIKFTNDSELWHNYWPLADK